MIKRYVHNQLNRNFSIAIIWINGGSNLDSKGKKGLNYMLSSLLTRGCRGFDNLTLSDFIESRGAELNHEVFEDGLMISLKSLNDHFNKLLPLLDLMIDSPTLSENQFKIVKKSTINSIKKDKENPFNVTFEKWRNIVYCNHPYAFNPMRYEKDIQTIKYQDLLNEYEDFRIREKYLISNNLDVKDDFFELYDLKVSKKESFSQVQIKNKESRFINAISGSNQTVLMLGNKTCSRESSEYLPLKILESYLSFGMSSLLFKLFREKNGITYDVGVFYPIRKNEAPFLVYLSVSNKNALLAFDILSKLWSKLLFSLIPEEELRLAKEKLKSAFLINNQSIDEILQRKIQLISYGIQYDSYEDYMTRIENVSTKDLQKIIKKYFSNPFLSVNGQKQKCLEIKNKFYSEF